MHRRSRVSEQLDRRDPVDHPTPAIADRVLALQRDAGNRAVSAVLARAPDPAKPETAEPTGARATLPDIGTIALLSVQFGRMTRPPRRDRQREPDGNEQTAGELLVSSTVGAHSARLMKMSLEGKPMDVEVILPSGVKLNLKGAMISGYSTSSAGGEQVESWTIDFESMEQSTGGG